MPAIRRTLPIHKVGIVDIGSNSVRLVIFEVAGAAFIPIYNEKVLAGLGRDLSVTGRLNPEGAELALNALRRFQALAEALKLPPLLIAATAALRDASDARAFIDAVKAQTGLNISPIDGVEEGRLSALGLLALEPRANGIAADLGGASLELIGLSGRAIGKVQSYKLGPFPVNGGAPDFDTGRLQDVIETVFSEDGVPFHSEVDTLYLIGGAWRNLALVHQQRTDYPLRMAQNFTMTTDDALKLATWACSPEGRDILSNWSGLSKRRLDTLPYCGLMMEDLIARFYPKRVTFAAAGLREGLIADSLGDALQDRNALFDACRAFRQSPMTGFGLALKAFIDPIGASIPAQFDAVTEDRLRQAACLLASTGAAKHPDHRADLVFQDVLYAPLPALNHKERAYIAQIVYASFTGRNTTPNEAAMTHLLSDEARQSARSYGYAMRLGAVISARSPKLLKHFGLMANDSTLSLTVSRENRSFLTEVAEIRLNKLASIAGFQNTDCCVVV